MQSWGRADENWRQCNSIDLWIHIPEWAKRVLDDEKWISHPLNHQKSFSSFTTWLTLHEIWMRWFWLLSLPWERCCRLMLPVHVSSWSSIPLRICCIPFDQAWSTSRPWPWGCSLEGLSWRSTSWASWEQLNLPLGPPCWATSCHFFS